ncbi:hypothetical protein MAR_013232 [Mya arenaria]|uniref:Uncharacterized protein n=1 Tax=Mya arenaria TaxID=6604 RepID=A0ABY7FZ93_MYAAR|nr:hypothetical protein MAR_013232 [Mya arenaria]
MTRKVSIHCSCVCKETTVCVCHSPYAVKCTFEKPNKGYLIINNCFKNVILFSALEFACRLERIKPLTTPMFAKRCWRSLDFHSAEKACFIKTLGTPQH